LLRKTVKVGFIAFDNNDFSQNEEKGNVDDLSQPIGYNEDVKKRAKGFEPSTSSLGILESLHKSLFLRELQLRFWVKMRFTGE